LGRERHQKVSFNLRNFEFLKILFLLLQRSNTWSKGTVLFLVDVRVSFCNYSKTSFLSISNRSIITEEPVVRQSAQLKMLAASVPVGEIDILNSISETITDGKTNLKKKEIFSYYIHNSVVALIKTVMSVQQIYDRIENGDSEPFTVLCYAVVIKFDLDGYTKIYRKIW
jgi:meiosis-specific with OB domain-containing protein